jgi:hypothetical protein
MGVMKSFKQYLKEGKKLATREDYYKLCDELVAIEKKTNLYLSDEGIDHENIPEGVKQGDDNYWQCMYDAACSAAGIRAEEEGYDINKLLGRDIY